MDPIIEAIIVEQIAGLRASAGVYVQHRADALAAAQAAEVAESGALARAAELQSSLDALRSSLAPVEPEPVDEEPDPELELQVDDGPDDVETP